MNMINSVIVFFIENWLTMVIGFALVIVAAVGLKKFTELALAEQKAKIKKWLLFAVTKAEAELGSGTGKLKLSEVYDQFVGAFPIVKNFISVERFTALVDEVLAEMRHLIETNENVEAYVANTY